MGIAIAERQRPHLPWRVAADVDHAQRAIGGDVDVPPVGLDDVRLVDPGLLHVGGGELGAR